MLNIKASRPSAAPALGVDAPRPGRVATLVVGDLISFLVFTTQGLSAHAEAETAGKIAVTAAPFIIGWFVAAPFLGAFGRRGSAATTRPRVLLGHTCAAWVAAWILALLLRRLVFGGGITPAFALVALLVNALFLLLWRGVVSSLLWRR